MNFRNLDVYRAAVRFLPIAAQLSQATPSGYGPLADRLRRASLSISLNIAEGSGKTSAPDQKRFYSIARGSAMECAAIVDACMALGFVETSVEVQSFEILERVVRMLSKMARSE